MASSNQPSLTSASTSSNQPSLTSPSGSPTQPPPVPSSQAASPTDIDPDGSRNFSTYSTAVNHIGAMVCREVVKKTYVGDTSMVGDDGWSLTIIKYLKDNKTKQNKPLYNVLTKKQHQKLESCEHIEYLDLTALFVLMNHACGEGDPEDKFWKNDGKPLRDSLYDLKDIRNDVAHDPKQSMKTQELEQKLVDLWKKFEEMINYLDLHPKLKANPRMKTFLMSRVKDNFDRIKEENQNTQSKLKRITQDAQDIKQDAQDIKQDAQDIKEILQAIQAVKLQSSSTQPPAPSTQPQLPSTQTLATIQHMRLEEKKDVYWPGEPIIISELTRLIHQSNDNEDVVKAAAGRLTDCEHWYSKGHHVSSIRHLLGELTPKVLDLHLALTRPSHQDLVPLLQDIANIDVKLGLNGARNESYDFALDIVTQYTAKCRLVKFYGQLSSMNIHHLPNTLEELVIFTKFSDFIDIMATLPHLPHLRVFGLAFTQDTTRPDPTTQPTLPATLPIPDGGDDPGAEGEAVLRELHNLGIKVKVLVLGNVRPLGGTRLKELRRMAEVDLAVCQVIRFYTYKP